MEKKCRGCGETKPLEEYYKAKTCKNGRCAKCKLCKKAYYLKNKEKILARAKEKYQTEAGKAYYLKNKEKILARAKEKYQTEAWKAYQKAYQKAYNQTEAGKEKRKKYKKYQQSEAGKEKRKAANKKYQQSEKGKAYLKNRYYNDPVYKLQHNLRVGFCQWIKGTAKTCKTEQYVGCTYKELLDHLERQFEEGMTWENHGRGDNKWQIDHFKAQSRFDPTIEEEAFKCWHYTNLQPMWAEINNGWKDKSKPGDENRIWMGREIGWVNI